ncbi:hypothetical protein PM082_011795 [Marasmius tenuissimus]|nr:hypothetical protein PM082_011795 [Marasmius tenuissimus]
MSYLEFNTSYSRSYSEARWVASLLPRRQKAGSKNEIASPEPTLGPFPPQSARQLAGAEAAFPVYLPNFRVLESISTPLFRYSSQLSSGGFPSTTNGTTTLYDTQKKKITPYHLRAGFTTRPAQNAVLSTQLFGSPA